MKPFIYDCEGAISPVEATDDMTVPVGQRDGQLFASNIGRLPDAENLEDYTVLEVQNGEWTPSLDMKERLDDITDDITEANDDMADINRDIAALQLALEGILDRLESITGIHDLTTLTEYVNVIEQSKAGLREKINAILNDADYQLTDLSVFGGTNNDYAGMIEDITNYIITGLQDFLVLTGDDDIIDLLNIAAAIRDSLKVAINALYDEPPIDSTTPLLNYSQYIVYTRPDNVAEYNTVLTDDDYFSYILFDKIKMKDTDTEGNPVVPYGTLGTTISWNKTLIYQCKDLELAHISTNFSSPSGDGTAPDLEKITIHTAANPSTSDEISSNTSLYNVYSFCFNQSNFRHLVLPEAPYCDRANIQTDFIIKNGVDGDRYIIDLPVLEYGENYSGNPRRGFGLHTNFSDLSTLVNGVELEINAPNLKILGGLKAAGGNAFNGNSHFDFSGLTGDFEFPSVTLWGAMGSNDHPLSFRLPSITKIGDVDNPQEVRWNGVCSSDINLYFGTELESIESYAVTYLGSENITIHIPAGDSTTKTVLDANNISYVQDYVIS